MSVIASLDIQQVSRTSMDPLELWGGVECTHNRVGENYFSQLDLSGHIRRLADLDLFADLGFTAMRYPVLWEKHAPTTGPIDWSWADERLARLRELGIRPIAGLVHHGSGPVYAPVESHAFAPGLAGFARKVAERFPWLDAYTPVNEPLTTARFCGLYRLWHPHGGEHRIFLRILVNECRATILAMAAVREINPAAILVQPDDLGRVYGTLQMVDEIDFQNHRRWLGWDLLCGKVTPEHALWGFLLAEGIAESELRWFGENACPPDIVGINHYPTSDRYLEHDTQRFPTLPLTRDAGKLHVDLEAVRVRSEPLGGFHERLLEAWKRYGRSLAITESHLGCTREEQMRWIAESWSSAERARQDGAEVVAVTAWSLLGSFNWNTLVTRDTGYYEPGVFDIRGGVPRPTALAPLLKSLAETGKPLHPLSKQVGWWQRPDRLLLARMAKGTSRCYNRRIPAERAAPLLIFGSGEILGQSFMEACRMRGLAFVAPASGELDLLNKPALKQYFLKFRPWAVVNAAGRSTERLQTSGDADVRFPLRLSIVCRDLGTALVCFSSAHVFSGGGCRPYLESTPTDPPDSFGKRQLAMENDVLGILPSALLVRSGPIFGSRETCSVLSRKLRSIRLGDPITIESDAILSPTFVPDLVTTTLDLLIDRASGIWHLANGGQTTWATLVRQVSQLIGWEIREITEVPSPRFEALGTEKGQILPLIDDAIMRYAALIKSA